MLLVNDVVTLRNPDADGSVYQWDPRLQYEQPFSGKALKIEVLATTKGHWDPTLPNNPSYLYVELRV